MNPKRATAFLWTTFGAGVLAAVPLALRSDRGPKPDRPTEPNATQAPPATTSAGPRDVKPGEPLDDCLVCRTANDVWSCREGQKVCISGKRQLASEGFSMIDRALNKGPTEHVTPLFSLHLADGAVATCSFGTVRRADYDAWLSKNPPGTEVTVLGAFRGPFEGTLLIRSDRVLPHGFQ